MSRDAHLRVMVGDVVVDASDLQMTSAINELSRTSLVAKLARNQTPDWSQPLTVEIDGTRVQTGSVVSALPTINGIKVDATSGVEMTERVMSLMSAEDFPVQDVVYDAARAAGFPRERMHIHGLDELPLEPVEVVAPLQGVRVREPIAFGPVTFLPGREGRRALLAFRSVPEAVSETWNSADAFALLFSNDSLLTEATEAAFELLDAALSLLVIRARFAYARLPDGALAHFTRATARCLPTQQGPIAVRGLLSGRRWLKEPKARAKREVLDLQESDLRWPAAPKSWSSSERLSWLAARRAASSSDPVEIATAISEAWEFYCADISPPPLFTADERARLEEELPEWLERSQRQRAADVLNKMLNGRSLWARVQMALERDGVPVTRSEWRVIRKVRKLRNKAVHGSEALDIDDNELDLALSVLSRAITYRIARNSSLGP